MTMGKAVIEGGLGVVLPVSTLTHLRRVAWCNYWCYRIWFRTTLNQTIDWFTLAEVVSFTRMS